MNASLHRLWLYNFAYVGFVKDVEMISFEWKCWIFNKYVWVEQ